MEARYILIADAGRARLLFATAETDQLELFQAKP